LTQLDHPNVIFDIELYQFDKADELLTEYDAALERERTSYEECMI